MTSGEACRLLDELFLQIEEPVAVNPDYTLWEVAYLLHKGFDLTRIRAYRTEINRMTVSQMRRFGSPGSNVTSQGEGELACRT